MAGQPRKLGPAETVLAGQIIMVGGRPQKNQTCQRIDWLTANHLIKLAENKRLGIWETLYQDPDDGRFWERTYPRSEMQGGGPPTLMVIPRDQARAKYKAIEKRFPRPQF